MLTYKLLIATYGFILISKALYLKGLVDSFVCCFLSLLLLLLLLLLSLLLLSLLNYNSCLFVKTFFVTWQPWTESELQTQLMDDVVDGGHWTPKHPEYRPR